MASDPAFTMVSLGSSADWFLQWEDGVLEGTHWLVEAVTGILEVRRTLPLTPTGPDVVASIRSADAVWAAVQRCTSAQFSSTYTPAAVLVPEDATA